MTSTILPAYALARRFLGRGHSLVAAALAVAVPSLAYSALVMTENAIYPIAVLALLALLLALERPTVARQVGAFAAIGLAIATKPKALLLGVAYGGAVLLYAALRARSPGRRFARELAPYKLTVAVFACGAALAFVLPTLALGRYRYALAALDLSSLPRQLLHNVAELDLYLAFAPFAASILVVAAAFARDADDTMRLFAALFLPTTVVFLVGASAFDLTTDLAQGRHIVHERNVFFIAPLFLVGLLMWLQGGRPRQGRRAALVFVGAALLPAVIPLYDVGYNAGFQALGLVPWLQLGLSSGVTRVAFVVLGLLVVAPFLTRGRSNARPIVGVAVVFVVVSLFAGSQLEAAGQRVASIAVSGERSWIDDAVGREADVRVVWREAETRLPEQANEPVAVRRVHRALWTHEYFNRSVGDVFSLGRPMPYLAELPLQRATLADDGTVLFEGVPVPGGLVLARCSDGVTGSVLAVHAKTRMVVVRTGATIKVGARGSGACPPAPERQ
jgi:hypothetical protein